MSQRQNTNNSIPSNALADLNDNTISLDEFINSTAATTTDRFNNKYKTVKQLVKDVEAQVAAAQKEGYVKIAGDRMTGNLAIKRDDATVTVLNNSNAGMAIKAEPSGNVSFNAVTDGNQQLKWYYNKISNQVIFSNLNDVQINSKSVLKQGEAAPFTSMNSQNNTKVQYKKLAEIFAFNANDEVKKVSFIISGGNSRVDKHNSLDFITFGVDGDKVHLAHQILSDSTSSANRLKVGWYYNKSTSSYELWLRFNRFRGAFGITRVSGISVGTTEYITDNVTEKITMEDKEISFVEPVLNLTSANIGEHAASIEYDYLEGTELNPMMISNSQVLSYVDKYIGKSVRYVPEVLASFTDGTQAWVEPKYMFWYVNQYVMPAAGISVSRLSSGHITIRAATSLILDNGFVQGLPVNIQAMNTGKFRLAIYK